MMRALLPQYRSPVLEFCPGKILPSAAPVRRAMMVQFGITQIFVGRCAFPGLPERKSFRQFNQNLLQTVVIHKFTGQTVRSVSTPLSALL